MKKDRKITVSGKRICFVAGTLSALCLIYWLVRALAFDDVNLIAIISSMCLALYLLMFGLRK